MCNSRLRNGACARNERSARFPIGRKNSRHLSDRLWRSDERAKSRARTIREGTGHSSSSIPVAGIIIAGLLAVTDPRSSAASEPIACGSTYVVASGDMLTAIAARAYGDAELASAIFAANAQILRDANQLSVGDELFVPCLRQDWPQSLQAAVESDAIDSIASTLSRPTGSIAPAIAPIPRPSVPPALRAVTAASLAPFAGETLTEGGLVTDLVRRAISAAGEDRELVVRFVGNSKSDAESLMSDGSFDVSFPWIKPDCDNPDNLVALARQRCEVLTFSRPIVELKVRFYRRVDDRFVLTTRGKALKGKWVCQVSGTDFLDLGKSFPKAVIESAPTVEECFELMQAGAVDIVAAPKRQAEAVIRRLGIVRLVAEIDELRTAYLLRATALRGDPAGEAAIAHIDRGLEHLMKSGEWFDVLVMHQRRNAAHW